MPGEIFDFTDEDIAEMMEYFDDADDFNSYDAETFEY